MVATFPHISQGEPEEAASFAEKKAQYLAAAKTSPGQKMVQGRRPRKIASCYRWRHLFDALERGTKSEAYARRPPTWV